MGCACVCVSDLAVEVLVEVEEQHAQLALGDALAAQRRLKLGERHAPRVVRVDPLERELDVPAPSAQLRARASERERERERERKRGGASEEGWEEEATHVLLVRETVEQRRACVRARE